MNDVRVAIVEDNGSLRESLVALLKGSPGFTCVCACATAEEALEEIPKASPHVVLMDINLPRRSGIECVRQLTTRAPQLLIIMLTVEEDCQRVLESLEAGAVGYLVKHVPPAAILAAVEEVHRGGSPMSSQIARMLVRTFRRPGPKAHPAGNLTEREEEVLRLVAKGYRSKEVAEALSLSLRTVEAHLRNIYDKLHVRSRTEAVAQFFRGG